MRSSPLGRLAVPVAIFLVTCLVLAVWGISQPSAYALAIAVLFEAVLFFVKRKRRARQMSKGVDLQTKLHDLKQQEFDLNYAKAKQDGTLDRWEKP